MRRMRPPIPPGEQSIPKRKWLAFLTLKEYVIVIAISPIALSRTCYMESIPKNSSDGTHAPSSPNAPLSGGGSNFQTHRLVFKENKIFIVPTKRYCALPLLFSLFGVVFLSLSFSKNAPSAFFLFAMAPLLFGLMIFLYMAFGKRPAFELTTRRFFPKGLPKNADDPMTLYTEGITLSDTEGLQLLSKTVSGNKGGRYLCYELNLKMRSGERIPLMNHGGAKAIREDARRLSEALSLPLEDATAATSSDTAGQFARHTQPKAQEFMSIAFGPVIALAGGAFLTFSLLVPAWRWYSYKTWLEVPAVIDRFELVSTSGSGSKKSYNIKTEYTYAVEAMPSKTFHGNRFNACPAIFSTSSYRYQYEKLAPTYTQGYKTVCYVDPKDYNNSVLFRKFPTETIPFAVPGALLLLIGIWVPISIRKRKKENEQNAPPAPPWK